MEIKIFGQPVRIDFKFLCRGRGKQLPKKYVTVIKRETGEVLIPSALWCSSWLCRLRGLQFKRRLKPGEAIILVKSTDSVAATSIHMFFVFFPIAAVWVNHQGRITTMRLAKPWRPFYASTEPACYVIETLPEFLNVVKEGDVLQFHEKD